MTLPPSVVDWKTQMESSPDTRQILQNLINEDCLHTSVESDFFNRLAARGVPASVDAAWNSSKFSVWDDPPLQCQRSAVPTGRFIELARYVLPFDLPQIIPSFDFTAASGISVGNLNRGTPSELQSLVDEINTASPALELGRLTWVAEMSTALEATTGTERMDRLGLPDPHLRQMQAGGCCIELRYQRTSLPAGIDLHAPSTLDAIDNQFFRPESNCAAPCGTTKPLTATSRMITKC